VPRNVLKGRERETFLMAAAIVFEIPRESLAMEASLVQDYGADGVQVYESVQDAEDIWGVRLLPPVIPLAEFPEAVSRFASLDSIIGAAEAARGMGRG